MFELIRDILCSGEGIPKETVFKVTRKREIVFTRQAIMYFSVEYKVGSLAYVGSLCGGKDHATFLHACRAIKNYIDTDQKKRTLINDYNTAIACKKIQSEHIKNLVNPQDKFLSLQVATLKKELDDLKNRVFSLECKNTVRRLPVGESIFPYSGYREHSR